MKTIAQILQLINNEEQIVIAIRGDIYSYEYMDYVKNSTHKEDQMDESLELDGSCAFMVWEYGMDNNNIDVIEQRIISIAEYAKGYGHNIHIIACEVGCYEWGWDETEVGQEIIMRDAWVIGKI